MSHESYVDWFEIHSGLKKPEPKKEEKTTTVHPTKGGFLAGLSAAISEVSKESKTQKRK